MLIVCGIGCSFHTVVGEKGGQVLVLKFKEFTHLCQANHKFQTVTQLHCNSNWNINTISTIFYFNILSLVLLQVLSAFQAQHTAAAAAAAAQSQLLIPLSSIPSYSAAMDTNPLLGSTYKKFPYPSMAEISTLAAQTQFTEEQIKVSYSQNCVHKVLYGTRR